jgi:hypothetical protein
MFAFIYKYKCFINESSVKVNMRIQREVNIRAYMYFVSTNTTFYKNICSGLGTVIYMYRDDTSPWKLMVVCKAVTIVQ